MRVLLGTGVSGVIGDQLVLAAYLFASDCSSSGPAFAARSERLDQTPAIGDTVSPCAPGAPDGEGSASGTSRSDIDFIDLTLIEMTVIALAHADPLWSAQPPRWRLLILFQNHGRLTLANPKIEALRCYVILSRRQGAIPGDATQALCEAGYSHRQIAAIDRHITLPRRRSVWTWPFRSSAGPTAGRPRQG